MGHRDWRWSGLVYIGGYRRSIRGLRDAFEQKILPSFDDLLAEANTIADSEYKRLAEPLTGQQNAGVDVLAEESAQEAACEYYVMMTKVRQGLLNLMSTALYHLHEQQLIDFRRRQNGDVAKSAEDVYRWLQANDIASDTFRCRSVIDELRCVANTVKHGDGPSRRKLRKARPELFVGSESRLTPLIVAGVTLPVQPRLITPLAGDDLALGWGDLTRYCDALMDFWDEFTDTLRRGACPEPAP